MDSFQIGSWITQNLKTLDVKKIMAFSCVWKKKVASLFMLKAKFYLFEPQQWIKWSELCRAEPLIVPLTTILICRKFCFHNFQLRLTERGLRARKLVVSFAYAK